MTIPTSMATFVSSATMFPAPLTMSATAFTMSPAAAIASAAAGTRIPCLVSWGVAAKKSRLRISAVSSVNVVGVIVIGVTRISVAPPIGAFSAPATPITTHQ